MSPEENVEFPPDPIVTPAIGWETIRRFAESDGTLGAPKLTSVSQIENGRPIFRVNILPGMDGYLAETSVGTSVWSNDCPRPKEVLIPPDRPNQCDWTICYPPKPGKTLVRKMSFYVSIFACSERPATLTLTRISDAILPDIGKVAIVHSVLRIEGVITITWKSFVLPGRGEVRSETENGTYYYGPDNREIRKFER